MADFLYVKTIDSGDESHNVDEEDENEELHTVTKKGKKKNKKNKTVTIADFNNDFTFSFGNHSEQSAWQMDKSIKNKAKGQVSSEVIEEKIKQKRKERKRKMKSEDKEETMEETKNLTENSLPLPSEDNIKNRNIDNDDDGDDDDDDGGDSDDDGGDDFSQSEDESNSEGEESDDKEFFVQPPPQVKYESFDHMNLSRPLLKAVNDLGFIHPTEIQSSTIPIALLGKDVCACATTGSGKTAAFMLPIIERLLFKPKQTSVTRVLVLVPTRELAIQVYSVSQSLTKYSNIQLCLATGGLDSKVQEAILRKGPDILIATPGRLIDHLHNTPSFDLQTIEILILDEADRMLEEHFKDQMTELIRLCPRGRQTMLFSATMTDEVEQLVSLSLNKPIKLFVDHNTDVAKNLHQEFIRIRKTREGDRLPIVAALCCRSFNEHTLVFLQTKHLTHKLRIILGLLGLKVAELHGNLSQLQRLEALETFKKNEVDILVATDLAARGLDISGVKTVISFNMPTTIKSYIHRVGRTARAGKAGRSVTLVGEKERKMLKEVVRNAPVPVKNRIISPDVIEKYKKKIDELEKDIKDILKQELEEKELRIAEMQMNKAKNMIVHRDEIMSKPAKTYIKPTKQPNKKQQPDKRTKNNSKLSDEEKKIRKEQEFFTRQIKRDKKPKRIRAFDENDDRPTGKGPKRPKLIASKKSFDRELTDVSRKRLRSLRATPHVPKKKTTGGFKSKSKHRRR